MEQYTDYIGIVHWGSERFNREEKEFQANAHLFDDNDERIQLVTDKHGDEYWIVGFTDPIRVSQYGNDIESHLFAIRVKDNCLMTISPSSLRD